MALMLISLLIALSVSFSFLVLLFFIFEEKPEFEIQYLESVDLSGAILSGSDLSGADFSYAILIEADFSGADLRGANLFLANLQKANLSKANLQNANLYGADLRGADLTGALDADLFGAVLDEVPRRLIKTPLSSEAQAARNPSKPEDLVEALQDNVHREIGKPRPARSFKAKKGVK